MDTDNATAVSEDGGRDAGSAPESVDLEFFQKWIVEICLMLRRQQMLRFTGLLTGLADISTRTLSRKLLVLQRMGLVDRTSFDTNPPRVEYRLTARGRAVADLLASLTETLDQREATPSPWSDRKAVRAGGSDRFPSSRVAPEPGMAG